MIINKDFNPVLKQAVNGPESPDFFIFKIWVTVIAGIFFIGVFLASQGGTFNHAPNRRDRVDTMKHTHVKIMEANEFPGLIGNDSAVLPTVGRY